MAARPGKKRKSGVREPNGRLLRPSKKGPFERGVYVMRAENTGFVKIGISRSPARRADMIQNGSPFPITVAFFVPLGEDAALRLERECHLRLRRTSSHVSGEWYRLRTNAAVEFVLGVAQELGLDLQGRAA